jgi:hypothetical protein
MFVSTSFRASGERKSESIPDGQVYTRDQAVFEQPTFVLQSDSVDLPVTPDVNSLKYDDPENIRPPVALSSGNIMGHAHSPQFFSS